MNQIDEITFHMGGVSATQAQDLAREISSQLALRLPDVPNDLRLNEINIRLNETQPGSPPSLAGHITDEIIRKISEAISQTK